MDIKIVLCNCKGLCPSFRGTDMNTLPFQLESELDVTYSVLHSQLCGQGGTAVLTDMMRSAGPDTYLVIGACAPEAQGKLFKKVLRATGFDERRLVPVDIRGTDNDGILERLRSAVQRLVTEKTSPPELAGSCPSQETNK